MNMLEKESPDLSFRQPLSVQRKNGMMSGNCPLRYTPGGQPGKLIFSHPDFDRRHRIFTCSAPRWAFVGFTTGMEFHQSPKYGFFTKGLSGLYPTAPGLKYDAN